MSDSRVPSPTTRLIGRDRECAVIDGLLDGAAENVSGSLVIRGAAGIGKSALLEHAERRGAVLRATGVEAESDLAFAGLFGLLRPVTSFLRELPDTQAAALAGALGLALSTGPDRFLVSAAVLGLLATAAEERPVQCLINDAQWLDTPSAEALVFVARRLGAERIAILFGAREGDVRRFEATGIRISGWTGSTRDRPPSSWPSARERPRRTFASGCWMRPPAIRWRCSSFRSRCPPNSWPDGRCCPSRCR